MVLFSVSSIYGFSRAGQQNPLSVRNKDFRFTKLKKIFHPPIFTLINFYKSKQEEVKKKQQNPCQLIFG